MNELIKLLIEWINSSKMAKEGLLLLGALAVIFSIFEYLLKNPFAVHILDDYRFHASAIALISFWISSLCWRFAKYRLLKLGSTTVLIVLGIIGAVMIVMHSRIEQIRLRIVFDESVQISPVAITKLVNLLESPLFSVEIQDTALTSSTTDNDAIAEIEARNTLQKYGLLRPNKNSTTVFVTGKNLSNPEWKNLLSIAWPEASIISIQGVGNSIDISEPTLTNYIATSVTMEALVSIALRQNESILDERQPNIYKGCLHDFHRTRSTYIGQSQTPKFCDAEARAIRNIYGTATLNAANDIFSKISYNK